LKYILQVYNTCVSLDELISLVVLKREGICI